MPTPRIKTYTRISFVCRVSAALITGVILSSHWHPETARRYYLVKCRDSKYNSLHRVYAEQIDTIYAPPPPALEVYYDTAF